MTGRRGRRHIAWSDVSEQVERTISAGLPDLFEAIRIPSVNAWGPENLSRSAHFLRDLLMKDKWAAETVNVPGNVIVFAQRGPEGEQGVPTILLYGHHDVQPPEPVGAWTSPPFEPVIRDGRLWGRGSSDDKGEFFCHLFAVRALSDVFGDLPVRLKLFLDGGEENGSPALGQAVETLRPKLGADFMYTADGPAHISGRPRISFGFRGSLRLSMTVRTADRNLHSGAWGNLAPQAPFRLAQILAAIKGPDGRVVVPGFYDGVLGPDGPERRALAEIPFDPYDTAASIGAASLEGPNDVPAMERLQFMPTLTVTGMSSGYTGPGFQSVIPAEAIARIEVRFVPDQDPERIFVALQNYLARTAPEAHLEVTGSMPPSRTPLDTPAAASVAAALKRGYGVEPLLYPSSGGSSPEALFTRGLGLPSLWGHCANYDQNNHAPDENMTLEAISKCTLSTAALLVDMARLPVL